MIKVAKGALLQNAGASYGGPLLAETGGGRVKCRKQLPIMARKRAERFTTIYTLPEFCKNSKKVLVAMYLAFGPVHLLELKMIRSNL